MEFSQKLARHDRKVKQISLKWVKEGKKKDFVESSFPAISKALRIGSMERRFGDWIWEKALLQFSCFLFYSSIVFH